MPIPPLKLAIYYGYPSAVNGSGGDVNLAAAVFKDYDIVIFGAGLEDSGHPDHANTTAIINHIDMVNTEVYGYIDATGSVSLSQTKIDNWYAMGVKGIFFDQFGYDFGLNRDKQNSIVWSAHEKGTGLKVFVNCWNVDDALGNAVDPVHNPTGEAHRINAGDLYLAESYQIVNGAYDANVAAWKIKADKMAAYAISEGVLMATTTTYDNSAYDQAKCDYAYYSTVLYDFNAFSFGEEFFSAASANLPFRPRKEILGDKFIGSIVEISAGVFEIQTNCGIHVDTNANTVNELLD